MSKKISKYHNKNLKSRNSEFQTKETLFTQDVKKAVSNESTKLKHLQKKAERANAKLQKAKIKLPKKREYHLTRQFDEKTGKAKYVLLVEEKEKLFNKENLALSIFRKAELQGRNFVHNKIGKEEKENSAVEGAHKTEQTIERGFEYAVYHHSHKKAKEHKKIKKLEHQQFKAETNFQYQKFLEENPQLHKKTIQKKLQKQRIKREYAKALQKGKTAKSAKIFATKATNITTTIAKKLQEFAMKNISTIIAVSAVALILIFFMSALSSCGAMLSGSVSATMESSYLSKPKDIDLSELALTEYETNLRLEIDDIEENNPGYDEYRYDLDEIGHNPFTLISYLSAVYPEFSYSEVETAISELFAEMYLLTLTPTTEIRTRTETRTGTRTIVNPDGSTSTEEYVYEVEVEYEVSILEVTLDSVSLESLVTEKLNEEQAERYMLYSETKGILQDFYSPLDTNWQGNISSYYGYRKSPITGEVELHRGLDIAVPTGTSLYSSCDGTVKTVAFDSNFGNYIVVEDNRGYLVKYAHLDSVNVSANQIVEHGDIIGKTGNTGVSTGSHLHIELMYEGEYYNPIFYFNLEM